jgi:Ca2+-binding EF-hand superfamily protein
MTRSFLNLALIAMISVTAFGTAAHANEHANAQDGKKGKLFERQDVNGDGKVTKDEFMKHAEEKFVKLDVNKDGSITPDEVEKMKQKWQELRKKKQEAGDKGDAPEKGSEE